jgi:uncharacterized protein
MVEEIKIDCHVHLVGNGKKGSKCWMKMHGWHRMMGFIIQRVISMPVGINHDDFDEIYVRELVGFVKNSSVNHALLLAQDEVYHVDGSKRNFGSFYVPNDYLFSVCKKHPEFFPAPSIHPARKDALVELDRCLDLGARALKLLPNCHNVNCGLSQYDKFWERMAETGLPLLAHTGGEMTVPVANKSYQNPEILRRPLEIGVKVIAAHSASNSGFFDDDYFEILINMMSEFSHLYADTSALNTPIRSAAFKKILDCNLVDRFIHGSDFPVPVGAWYARLRGLIDEKSRKAAAQTSNLLERDYLLKRTMGFSDNHFTKANDILRQHS